MQQRKIWFLSALTISLLVFILLVTGSSILVIPLDKNDSIPLGTFITWFGIIALPLSIYWGIKELREPTNKYNKYLSVLLKIMLVLAVLWVPICYLLAGNLSFSFTEKETFQGGQQAMRWFWRLSYGVGLGPVILLIIYWLCSLLKKMNANNVDK